MNNVKISVLACLTLALCAFGSVEAGSDKKKCLNPIVGTWNLTMLTGLFMDVPTLGPLEGSATFYKDCTVVFATSPKNPQGVFPPPIVLPPSPQEAAQFSTQSYGIWKQVGPCEYKVILSNTFNDPTGVIAPFRNKIEIDITLKNNCTMFDLPGKVTVFDITNPCFDPPIPLPSFDLVGEGCKLSFNC